MAKYFDYGVVNRVATAHPQPSGGGRTAPPTWERTVNHWLRRIRGVVGIGFTWAVLWALVGGLIEAADNVTPGGLPAVHVVDMWPQTLALLGFPHGMAFAVVLGVARGRRRFEEFSFALFAACGAAAGLALGALALARGASVGYLGVTTLLSAAAGAGSLALARAAGRRGLLGAGAEAAGARLTGGPPNETRVRRR